MYYGKETKELLKLRKQYEDIFGHDPNGEMELEFGNCKKYTDLLRECIETKRTMFEVLGIKDMDDEF